MQAVYPALRPGKLRSERDQGSIDLDLVLIRAFLLRYGGGARPYQPTLASHYHHLLVHCFAESRADGHIFLGDHERKANRVQVYLWLIGGPRLPELADSGEYPSGRSATSREVSRSWVGLTWEGRARGPARWRS
jgi:hypothetical protein